MNRSEPEWYEALRDNPFRRPTFTDDLSANIRQKVAQSEARRTPIHPGRMAKAIGMVSFVGLVLLISITFPFRPFEQEKPTLAQAEHSLENHDYWQNLIELRHPYYPSFNTQVIQVMAKGEDKTWVLNRHQYEHKDGEYTFSFGLDIFEKRSGKWRHVKQASEGFFDPETYRGLMLKLQMHNHIYLDNGKTPVFLGVIMDPQIKTVRVVDPKGDFHTAELFDIGDEFTYYFTVLPPRETGIDLYKVEGLDEEGSVIADRRIH